jgi:hypothetical protein
MKAGAAEVDITPEVGVELCGYAARVQPSVGVMDRLFCRGVYLEAGGGRLLWVVLDLIAVPGEVVEGFRSWAGRELGLRGDQVMVSATHTHSAPATIQLNAAGRRDERYMRRLPGLMQEAARQAVGRLEACEIVTAEGECGVANDRRKTRTALVDFRTLGVGFRRADNTFVATVLNYPMHPVALGHVNREVSPDWPGYASEAMAGLPGRPVSLVTNGACGNMNPPAEGWSRDQVRELGRAVAESVRPTLAGARAAKDDLRTKAVRVAVPLEVLTPARIEEAAAAELAKIGRDHPWFRPIRDAIETWKLAEKPATVEIELHAVRLGGVTVLGVNCEMFAHFTECLRAKVGPGVYVVGYTNGAFGYVAHSAAYDEGGYEVDSAHFFYNSFRPVRGALEMLCERAAGLIESMAE